MATIYISSTFADLKEYRDTSIKVLRKAKHSIVAMEDYVATGRYTPLKKCLDDVAHCDYYVGIFAWRYGYIPDENNPEGKSITELEYRQACRLDKPRFIFLLDSEADWSPKFMDACTGDGERGNYIQALRAELGKSKLASFFKTPDELSSLVIASVNHWEQNIPLRQQQKYVDSKYLDVIEVDLQSLESLNSSLKLAQEMQNSSALSEELTERFKKLKGEGWDINNLLNNRFQELGKAAKNLVSEMRLKIEKEGEDIAQDIAQNGRENVDLKRIESYEKLQSIIRKFEREIERGREVAQWIKDTKQELVKDSVSSSLKHLEREGLIQIEDSENIKDLYLEIEQYLRRIAVAMSLGRTTLLDAANGLNEFPPEVYKIIFGYIKERKVKAASKLLSSQKELLIFYIDHLIRHVFTEP